LFKFEFIEPWAKRSTDYFAFIDPGTGNGMSAAIQLLIDFTR
jgi:hypothetical protein|tara:strand:+ start:883 stop:1008 length:126 start_codon:yes stop_codon:yes gene_type:complete